MRHATRGLLTFLCLAAASEGSVVTSSFTGVITEETGSSPYSVGQAFLATLSYDADTPGVSEIEDYRFNYYASSEYPVAFGLHIGGDSYQQVATSGTLFVNHGDEGYDNFNITTPGFVVGLYWIRREFGDEFGPYILNSWTSADLPRELRGDDYHGGSLAFGGLGWTITGSINLASIIGTPDTDPDPRAIPEPSTLALAGIGLGLLGMGWARRRLGHREG